MDVKNKQTVYVWPQTIALVWLRNVWYGPATPALLYGKD